MNQLVELTGKLITYLDDFKVIFHDDEIKPSKDEAFFRFVQQETKPYFSHIDAWEKHAKKAWKEKLISLQLTQIESTRDNFTTLILHSYYKDVRKRRYMEINKSCFYILQQILKEIHHERQID